ERKETNLEPRVSGRNTDPGRSRGRWLCRRTRTPQRRGFGVRDRPDRGLALQCRAGDAGGEHIRRAERRGARLRRPR
ncbi:MAG: hypothetical protein AVDCRST_MAG93-3319, partial [uncultured Chloroflexia bacterium]